MLNILNRFVLEKSFRSRIVDIKTNICQITWSDSIYEKDRSVSILFVLDTNFQLSMYNHRFELIHELTSHYVIPTQTRENNASEYIDNIQSVSNLCILFHFSILKNLLGYFLNIFLF
jgi:hypothetical protein